MAELRDRVALVTGGAQGIGRGIAAHLLSCGMRVTIADVDAEAGAECLAEYGGELHFVETDVSDETAVQRCIGAIRRHWGRLDALVNNAGLANPGDTPVEQLELADWQRRLAVNLTGCFLTVKHAAPLLRDAHGAVVNIASTRALQSEPHSEAYAASKGGIVALTHALAVSFSGAIRVNCISPGWIAVDDWQKAARRREPDPSTADHAQHPAGRVGRPGDVAAMAAFLLSDAAGFITGQNFIVDGGMTRKMIYLD